MEKVSWQNIVKLFGKELFLIEGDSQKAKAKPQKDSEHSSYIKTYSAMIIGGTNRTKISYSFGNMFIGGQKLEVREIVLSRLSGRQQDSIKLAIKISKKFKCILENRTHEQRLEDLLEGTEFGRFHVKEFSSRSVEEALDELVWWHLCGISQALAEFSLKPEERLPVRRLRIEIRKFRAVLTMLKGTFLSGINKWRERFRFFTVKLSRLRELDVALSAWRSAAINIEKSGDNIDRLSFYLASERKLETQKAVEVFSLTYFTPVLLEFMHFVKLGNVQSGKDDVLLDKIADKRLNNWFRQMNDNHKLQSDFSDDIKSHAIRVKAKCMRYVMQSMSGRAYGDENKVMRSLKKLLDALGVLHDNYVNEQIVGAILKKQHQPELVFQAGIFVGAQRAQSLRVRKLLPDLWDKFVQDWQKWNE